MLVLNDHTIVSERVQACQGIAKINKSTHLKATFQVYKYSVAGINYNKMKDYFSC